MVQVLYPYIHDIHTVFNFGTSTINLYLYYTAPTTSSTVHHKYRSPGHEVTHTRRASFKLGGHCWQDSPDFHQNPNLIVDDVVYGIVTYPRGCLSDPVERGAPGVRDNPIEYFFDIQYHLYRLHFIYLPDRWDENKKFFRFCPPLGLVRSL